MADVTAFAAEFTNGIPVEIFKFVDDIINKNNPATNTYHTWIRKIEDIKTYEEVIQDEEAIYTPDYTEEMAKQYLKKGIITIYSSYPIKQGTFITPSLMEAKGYAGEKNIYSKTIPLDYVAWIDTLEGQYANTNENNDKSSA